MLTVAEAISDVHSINNTYEMTISLSGVSVPCSALFSVFYAYLLHGFGPRNWIL